MSPFTAKPPFVTGERRAVERERERERGRATDAEYRRGRRGERWKEASRKGGVRHKDGKHLLFIFSALNRAVSAW